MSVSNTNNIDDSQLLENYYNTKDNKWLGILLQRYTLLLFGVSMKYLKNESNARDAVQQVFLKAINEIPKYKISYFKSWIYMVAKNYCLMQLREKKVVTELDADFGMQQESFDIETYQQKDADLNFLELAIAELNVEQKQCIELFYLQKKSYQDIVEATSFSMLQVKSYIQNGKRNLKILIEQKRLSNNGK